MRCARSLAWLAVALLLFSNVFSARLEDTVVQDELEEEDVAENMLAKVQDGNDEDEVSEDNNNNDEEAKDAGTCSQQTVAPKGSPCPNGYVQWADPQAGTYVPGYDLAALGGKTVETCRDYCWTYPGCVSADLTTAGVCYLNYAKGPTASSPVFTLLNFQCCQTSADPQCQQVPSTAGQMSPCPSGSAKWKEALANNYLGGYDIKAVAAQTITSCQTLCWNTPGCKSADQVNDGTCYLNYARKPLSQSGIFSYLDFECCDGPPKQCQQKPVASTGSPCPKGNVRWDTPVSGKCVLGMDIVSQAGMTVESCQDYCWNMPGCLSADLTYTGVCYLNSVTGSPPAAGSTVSECLDFFFLNFTCCGQSEPASCTTVQSAAGGSGPCFSGTAKFLETQPGKYVPGYDIKVVVSQTVESCRQLCWNTAGCKSADITYTGVCYLNNVREPVSTSPIFSFIDIDCCSGAASQCLQRPVSEKGSPCPNGYVQWVDPQVGTYVPGNDLAAIGDKTVETCRDLCWLYPGCVSADLTTGKVCYINSVKGPTATSPVFSLLNFDCCRTSLDPQCQQVQSSAGQMGPCPSGIAKWKEASANNYISGYDIKAVAAQTVTSCQTLCWNTPGCKSADLVNDGTCYLNYAKITPLSQSGIFSYLDFECCDGPPPQCQQKPVAPAGSPCANGYVKWDPPVPSKCVLGMDIISEGGKTVETCQDYCWSMPGCLSADLTYTGVCYLNFVTGSPPVAGSTLSTCADFFFLNFTCCNTSEPPQCSSPTSNAGGSGPCSSGKAKFLEAQPGKYVAGYDIQVATAQTVDSCRQLCWNTPNCKSADITNAGVCYLNSVRQPVGTSTVFSFIDFECCSGEPPQCGQKDVTPTGSPCPNGYVKWEEPVTDRCIIGMDISVLGGKTVATCRDYCWSMPGCLSADLTTGGLCYLNYVSGAPGVAGSTLSVCAGFQFLNLSCCQDSAAPDCTQVDSRAGGSGPCNSNNAKFLTVQPGKYVPGYDIQVTTGMTVQSCQTLCWNTAGCKSADITYAGVCYLNSVRQPVSTSGFFSLIDFDCCGGAPALCNSRPVSPTGSPCPNGYVQWAEPQQGSYVLGMDLTYAYSKTVDTCRDFCWTYPGCVSADLTTAGVCYLNYATGPKATSTAFSLLEFSCCQNSSEALCQSLPSAAGQLNACPSGVAKWKEAQATKYVAGYDIKAVASQTVTSCQTLCWNTAGCLSADLVNDGTCYLNYAKKTLSQSGTFSYLDFECCEGQAPECQQKAVAPAGSPCPNGYVKWATPVPGKCVLGMDITYQGSMTVQSCQDFCWSMPGCLSADLTYAGVCYLNYVTGSPPAAGSTLADCDAFYFLNFTCCRSSTKQPCQDTASGGAASCASGKQRALEAQPGNYIIGYDLKVILSQTVDSCRQQCLSTPGCLSADLTYLGVCYLNSVRQPVASSTLFSFLDFECCTSEEVATTTTTTTTAATPTTTISEAAPVSTTPVSTTTTAAPCKNESRIDITFLLDSSGSIGADNFNTGLRGAVKDIINYMLPGPSDQPSGNRVAAVSFDTDAYLQWKLDTYTTKDQLLPAVDTIPYNQGMTATGTGLHKVLTDIQPTVRDGVKHVVILITDGDQNYGSYSDLTEAANLKQAGAIIFAIGVGDDVQSARLDQLASGKDYRADVTNYGDLKNRVRDLATIACKANTARRRRR